MKWFPDTCGCGFEMTAGESIIRSVKSCSRHAALSGQAHLDAVLLENRDRNTARAAIAGALGVYSAEVPVSIGPNGERRIHVSQGNLNRARTAAARWTNRVEITTDPVP